MMRLWRDAFAPVLICGTTLFLPLTWVIGIFMVFGYSHFFLGYWYRFRAAPRERLKLVVGAGVLAGGFVLYFAFYGAFLPIFFLTGILFSAHFACDEFFLHGEKLAGWKWLTLALFFSLYLLLTVSTVLPDLELVRPVALLLLLAGLGVRLTLGGRGISHSEQYLALVACLIFLISLFGSAEHVLGAVIFLHFYNWYEWGALRAYQVPGRSYYYWRDVVLSVGVFAGLYSLYLLQGPAALAFLYTPIFYYSWTIGHIVLATRYG